MVYPWVGEVYPYIPVGGRGVPGVYALPTMVAILPGCIYPDYTTLGTPLILPLIHHEQAGHTVVRIEPRRQPGL